MIHNLDDTRARRILAAVVRSRIAEPRVPTGWSPALGQALAGRFEVQPESPAVSEGELARQSLLVLAEDPEMRRAIETMAANWNAFRQKFDLDRTLGTTAAVLLVLQTRLKFARASDGKWSVKVEKKSTSDALLKGLVQKLISFAG